MINLEDFIKKCELGYCLRQTIKSKRCNTKGKQEDCYKKYILKSEKDVEKRKQIKEKQKEEFINKIKNKEYSQDEEWNQLKERITKRDNNTCRFYATCTNEEKAILDKSLFGVFKILDGAHYLPRSRFPEYKMCDFNVVLLYRYVHTCLDNMINPFTKKKLSQEEHEQFWRRIIGDEEFKQIQERVKQDREKKF